MLSDTTLSTLAHAIDIPSSHAHITLHQFIAELTLGERVHTDIGLDGVFILLRLAPHLSDKATSVEHRPPIVNVTTGIAPVFVEHVQMVCIKVLLKIFTICKLAIWKYLVGLPVGTALPPAVIIAAAPSPAPTTVVVARGITAQVGRYQILERMTNLMGYGMSATGISSPRIEMT